MPANPLPSRNTSPSRPGHESSILHLKWIFVLDADLEFDLKKYLPDDFLMGSGCAFEDRNGNRWLEIYPDGTARILAGYAWDGCSPKLSFWDIVIGTPDGRPHVHSRKPKTYTASLVHDALYQFLDAGLPISRATADRIFLDLLEENDFKPRRIYHAGVRIFGRGYLLIMRWKREYDGRKIPLDMTRSRRAYPKIQMEAIGHVEAARTDIADDCWGGGESCIVLAEKYAPEALQGIEEFSHVEVIYHFDRVDPSKIVAGARHPRNNPDWPEVGIFAQRGKNRPNRIGSTICRVLRREGRRLFVAELDAVDGTPVLDIKPVMQEFLPREEVRQPEWSHELMRDYWNRPSADGADD